MMRGAYLIRRPVDNVYLVRERDRRRRRELLTILLAIAPVGVCLLVYIWTHLQVLEAGYRIDDLAHRLHDLAQKERHLQLEVSRLANPVLLEQRATEQLAMEAPGHERIFLLKERP